jgi:hypothetical protein
MKTKLLLTSVLSLILLSACQTAEGELSGTWERQGTYMNGELEHQAPAMIVMAEGQFSSSTEICTVSGSYEASEGQMTVTMKESDCPAPLQLPYTITYDYTLENNTLNLISQGIREEYQRQ